MARGDGPFKVLARVGANAYKLELLGGMAISATFNVGDLSSYIQDEIHCGDLRANPLKEGENDVDRERVQDPHPEPEKGLMFSHQQGQFCEVMQLSFGATLEGLCFLGHPSITASQTKSFKAHTVALVSAECNKGNLQSAYLRLFYVCFQ